MTSENEIGNNRLTTAAVIGHVCLYYGCNRKKLLGRSKAANYVRARHVAIYLLRTWTSKSYPQIGRELGGMDHSSVLYAYRKINKKLEAGDLDLSHELYELDGIISKKQAPPPVLLLGMFPTGRHRSRACIDEQGQVYIAFNTTNHSSIASEPYQLTKAELLVLHNDIVRILGDEMPPVKVVLAEGVQ